jgi:hypothetical protein
MRMLVLVALALPGCVTGSLHAGPTLTIDSERRTTLQLATGAMVGVTSMHLDDAMSTGLLFEGSAGIDLGDRRIIGSFGAGIVISYLPVDDRYGHRGALLMRARFGRGTHLGPSLAYTLERILDVEELDGSCADEGAHAHESLGFGLGLDLGFPFDPGRRHVVTTALRAAPTLSYAKHVHPLTECSVRTSDDR